MASAFLKNNINHKEYLNLIKEKIIEKPNFIIKNVSLPYTYPKIIRDNHLCSRFGHFMEIFIRRELYINDMLKNIDILELDIDLIRGVCECENCSNKNTKIQLLCNNYKILKNSQLNFIDKNKESLNIINDIWILSSLECFKFNKFIFIPNFNIENDKIKNNIENIINLESFKSIQKYIKERFIQKVETEKIILTELFNGYCDIIENNMIIDIKNTQDLNFKFKIYLQLILYSLIAKIKYKYINKIQIYNPYYGKEYTMDINFDMTPICKYICEKYKGMEYNEYEKLINILGEYKFDSPGDNLFIESDKFITQSQRILSSNILVEDCLNDVFPVAPSIYADYFGGIMPLDKNTDKISIIFGIYTDLINYKGITSKDLHFALIHKKLNELIHKKNKYKESMYYKKFCALNINLDWINLVTIDERYNNYTILDDNYCPNCKQNNYYDNKYKGMTPDCNLCFQLCCKLCSKIYDEEHGEIRCLDCFEKTNEIKCLNCGKYQDEKNISDKPIYCIDCYKRCCELCCPHYDEIGSEEYNSKYEDYDIEEEDHIAQKGEFLGICLKCSPSCSNGILSMCPKCPEPRYYNDSD